MAKYLVHLIDSNGNGSYLSVHGKTAWSKRTAIKHANDIRALIAKGKPVFDVVCVDIESEFGETIKEKQA